MTLEVFDVAGRRVTTLVDEMIDTGAHTATWNGRDAKGRSEASGVYFCRLAADGKPVDTRRIVIVR